MTQADTAYNQITELIIEGKMSKEYPIFEQDLAEQFNMSRTPIREALKRLIAEGTVAQFPRRGIFIKTLSRQEVNEIYVMSEALEGMVAYIVAQKRTKMDIEKMKALLAQMEKHYEDGDSIAWAEADEGLHNLSYALCGNKYITEALSRINNQVHKTRYLISRVSLDKKQSNVDHKAIIEAVESGDAELARHLAFKHLSRVREQVVQFWI